MGLERAMAHDPLLDVLAALLLVAFVVRVAMSLSLGTARVPIVTATITTAAFLAAAVPDSFCTQFRMGRVVCAALHAGGFNFSFAVDIWCFATFSGILERRSFNQSTNAYARTLASSALLIGLLLWVLGFPLNTASAAPLRLFEPLCVCVVALWVQLQTGGGASATGGGPGAADSTPDFGERAESSSSSSMAGASGYEGPNTHASFVRIADVLGIGAPPEGLLWLLVAVCALVRGPQSTLALLCGLGVGLIGGAGPGARSARAETVGSLAAVLELASAAVFEKSREACLRASVLLRAPPASSASVAGVGAAVAACATPAVASVSALPPPQVSPASHPDKSGAAHPDKSGGAAAGRVESSAPEAPRSPRAPAGPGTGGAAHAAADGATDPAGGAHSILRAAAVAVGGGGGGKILSPAVVLARLRSPSFKMGASRAAAEGWGSSASGLSLRSLRLCQCVAVLLALAFHSQSLSLSEGNQRSEVASRAAESAIGSFAESLAKSPHGEGSHAGRVSSQGGTGGGGSPAGFGPDSPQTAHSASRGSDRPAFSAAGGAGMARSAAAEGACLPHSRRGPRGAISGSDELRSLLEQGGGDGEAGKAGALPVGMREAALCRAMRTAISVFGDAGDEEAEEEAEAEAEDEVEAEDVNASDEGAAADADADAYAASAGSEHLAALMRRVQDGARVERSLGLSPGPTSAAFAEASAMVLAYRLALDAWAASSSSRNCAPGSPACARRGCRGGGCPAEPHASDPGHAGYGARAAPELETVVSLVYQALGRSELPAEMGDEDVAYEIGASMVGHGQMSLVPSAVPVWLRAVAQYRGQRLMVADAFAQLREIVRPPVVEGERQPAEETAGAANQHGGNQHGDAAVSADEARASSDSDSASSAAAGAAGEEAEAAAAAEQAQAEGAEGSIAQGLPPVVPSASDAEPTAVPPSPAALAAMAPLEPSQLQHITSLVNLSLSEYDLPTNMTDASVRSELMQMLDADEPLLPENMAVALNTAIRAHRAERSATHAAALELAMGRVARLLRSQGLVADDAMAERAEGHGEEGEGAMQTEEDALSEGGASSPSEAAQLSAEALADAFDVQRPPLTFSLPLSEQLSAPELRALNRTLGQAVGEAVSWQELPLDGDEAEVAASLLATAGLSLSSVHPGALALFSASAAHHRELRRDEFSRQQAFETLLTLIKAQLSLHAQFVANATALSAAAEKLHTRASRLRRPQARGPLTGSDDVGRLVVVCPLPVAIASSARSASSRDARQQQQCSLAPAPPAPTHAHASASAGDGSAAGEEEAPEAFDEHSGAGFFHNESMRSELLRTVDQVLYGFDLMADLPDSAVVLELVRMLGLSEATQLPPYLNDTLARAVRDHRATRVWASVPAPSHEGPLTPEARADAEAAGLQLAIREPIPLPGPAEDLRLPRADEALAAGGDGNQFAIVLAALLQASGARFRLNLVCRLEVADAAAAAAAAAAAVVGGGAGHPARERDRSAAAAAASEGARVSGGRTKGAHSASASSRSEAQHAPRQDAEAVRASNALQQTGPALQPGECSLFNEIRIGRGQPKLALWAQRIYGGSRLANTMHFRTDREGFTWLNVDWRDAAKVQSPGAPYRKYDTSLSVYPAEGEHGRWDADSADFVAPIASLVVPALDRDKGK